MTNLDIKPDSVREQQISIYIKFYDYYIQYSAHYWNKKWL